jgi:hypothetical protein
MKPYYVYDQVTQQFVEASGANPVNIAGYDGFEFFVHPVLLGNGTWGNAWVVSEATTGTRISSRWGKTQKDAITNAAARLERSGSTPAELDKIRAEQLRKTGLSPKYQQEAPCAIGDGRKVSLHNRR